MNYLYLKNTRDFVTRRVFLQTLAVGGGLLAISSKFNLAKTELFTPTAPELSSVVTD
ncbi:MAG: twin-arginine translocation signal domain-containing protein [Gallionella sp.]